MSLNLNVYRALGRHGLYGPESLCHFFAEAGDASMGQTEEEFEQRV